jgi:hypothetical protein
MSEGFSWEWVPRSPPPDSRKLATSLSGPSSSSRPSGSGLQTPGRSALVSGSGPRAIDGRNGRAAWLPQAMTSPPIRSLRRARPRTRQQRGRPSSQLLGPAPRQLLATLLGTGGSSRPTWSAAAGEAAARCVFDSATSRRVT